jgi:toxin-antitoxin system PIN domain toxin
MPALVDANVWLPILCARHSHHAVATAWWNAQAAASCCWCRPIQQTILRLLTNRTVMGEDTLTPDEAWLVWEKLALDERCALLPLEPVGLEDAWQRHIAGRAATPKLWMDAYLAAWAETARLTLVTFDSGFRSFPLASLQILQPE